jgi:lipopolysaccharide/colanic/teichoic acid biosynthesis glycosyltransferase
LKAVTPVERIEDFSDEALREDLYRRFSARGLRRRRLKRVAHSVTWIVLVQSLAFVRRALDILIAYVLFRILSPLLLLTFLLLRVRGVAIKRTPKLGRWCEPFDEFSFAIPDTRMGRILRKLKVERMPVLMNIVKGNMSFIGPRAVSPGEISLQERAARKRHDVRPGLLCLWWIRQRANIDYGGEFDSDAEYVDTHSAWNDFTLTLRAIPAVLYGQPAGIAPD